MRKQPALSVLGFHNLLYNEVMVDRRKLLLGMIAAVAALLAADLARAHSCTCRNRDGSKYQLGQIACLRVDGNVYMARCEMDLNVSTWKKLRDGCPTAGMSTPGSLAGQSIRF